MTNPSQLDPGADTEEASQALDELYRKLVPLGRIGQPGGGGAARAVPDLRRTPRTSPGQPFVIDGGWLAGVSVL